MQLQIHRQTFHLLPQKAIFWEEKSMLIMADMHLGKVSHFRKSGISVPARSAYPDLECWQDLLLEYSPTYNLVLGDLFHSDYNQEWKWVEAMIQNFNNTSFMLLKGNHEVLDEEKYFKAGWVIYTQNIVYEDLVFTHEPLPKNLIKGNMNICGHIHPGVLLRGKAHQAQRLPCFYHTPQHLILPAFSALAGMQVMNDQDAQAEYYAVVNQNVQRMG